MNTKFTILTVHHKKDLFLDISKKFFSPIQVGKAINSLDLKVLSDDDGENISNKNKNFCELTACFWGLKNLNTNYIGLMHYRRIFTQNKLFFGTLRKKISYILKCIFKPIFGKAFGITYNSETSAEIEDIDKISKEFNIFLEKNIEEYDLILPKKVKYRYFTLEQQYRLYHNYDDFEIFKHILIEKFPEMKNALYEAIKSKGFYLCNMFIMKKDIFQDYHNKLFSILFEMEKVLNLNSKNDYQKRVYGFISERFLYIYYLYLNDKYEDLKILELNTIFIKNI